MEDHHLVSILMQMSQQKQEDSAHMFLGETLGSIVLDSGTSELSMKRNGYECFLETIPEKQKTEKFKMGWGLRSLVMKTNWNPSTQPFSCVSLQVNSWIDWFIWILLKRLMYLQLIFGDSQNVYMVWLMLLSPSTLHSWSS